MRTFAVCSAVIAFALGTAAAVVFGQETPKAENGGVTPLGIRQQRVERMMEEVDRKFRTLAAALQEKEPERAELLIKTIQQARELLVQDRMAQITKLLDQKQLDPAGEEQKKVLGDIRKLLALLTEDKRDRDKAREEFEQLQKWKEEIEDILKEERGLKRESDKVANKEDTLAALARQVKALEMLIEQEKEVIKATEKARAEGIQGLGPIAEKQRDVREKTEKLAEEIAGAGAEPKEGKPTDPAEGKPSQGKPSEGKPSEGKPSEGKPSEGKPAEGKPSEGKPSEGKPSEGKPSEGKPSEGKPSEGKPSEGKPSEGSPSGGEPMGGESSSQSGSASKKPPEAGERNLKAAAAQQKQAESELQQGKGKASQESEEKALEELKRALAELKKESQRIASLPPEAFEKMAGKQDDNAAKTEGLKEKMQQASASKGGQGGQGGKSGESGGGEQKDQPGQQSVQQAKKSMEQASGDLRKKDPEDASRKQKQAIKDLEKALQEIEERLAQLREDTQLEKLARLEARFREMLARQQKASADTLAIHARRDEEGNLKRAENIALTEVADEELKLSEAAQQAYDIIYEDGTSVVFPDVVGNLRNDLQRVAEILADKKTDTYTQSLQKEIELTLEELIEALQKAQQQKEGGGGGGGGGGMGGEPPLLPSSAELKLLRAAQLRVNRRTEAIDAAKANKGNEEVLKTDLQTASRRQAEIAEMTIRILERN